MVIVAIAGAYYFFNNKSCKNIDNEAERNFCIANLALQNQDVSLCEQTTGLGQEEGCIIDVAIAKKDESLCERISN